MVLSHFILFSTLNFFHPQKTALPPQIPVDQYPYFPQFPRLFFPYTFASENDPEGDVNYRSSAEAYALLALPT